MTKTTVEETKNVEYQYWSSQLQDASSFAKQQGKQFVLWIRKSTRISNKVIDNWIEGNVIIKFIPGSK